MLRIGVFEISFSQTVPSRLALVQSHALPLTTQSPGTKANAPAIEPRRGLGTVGSFVVLKLMRQTETTAELDEPRGSSASRIRLKIHEVNRTHQGFRERNASRSRHQTSKLSLFPADSDELHQGFSGLGLYKYL